MLSLKVAVTAQGRDLAVITGYAVKSLRQNSCENTPQNWSSMIRKGIEIIIESIILLQYKILYSHLEHSVQFVLTLQSYSQIRKGAEKDKKW